MAGQSAEMMNGNVEGDEKHKVVPLLEYLLANPKFPISGDRERIIAVLSGKVVPSESLPLDQEDHIDSDDITGPTRVSEQ
jgi:hypothetical protein